MRTALISLLATACGASPEKVCNHLFELKQTDHVAAGNPALDEAKSAEAKQECGSWIAERKKQYSAEIYEAMTSCILDAKDVRAANRCKGNASDTHRGYDPAKLESEFAALATALDGPLDGLRAIDGDLLALAKAMEEQPDHRFETVAKIQMKCEEIGTALAAIDLDPGKYSQKPVQDVLADLSRARDTFQLSRKACQGIDCAAACAQGWTDVVRASQSAELGAKIYDATIEPIRPRAEGS